MISCGSGESREGWCGPNVNQENGKCLLSCCRRLGVWIQPTNRLCFARACTRAKLCGRASRERAILQPLAWANSIQCLFFPRLLCVRGGALGPLRHNIEGGGRGVKLELSISIFRISISDFWKFHSFWIFDCRFSDCWSTQGSILIFSIFVTSGKALFLFWIIEFMSFEFEGPGE